MRIAQAKLFQEDDALETNGRVNRRIGASGEPAPQRGRLRSPWFLTMVLIFILCGMPGTAAASESSWRVDRGAFHASAHSEFACLDCHEDVADQALHPNPDRVNQNPRDAFTPDACAACHDMALEEIQAGMHAGEPVEDPALYETCVECHNPHQQVRLDDLQGGRFDPSQPVQAQCGACHEVRSVLPPLDPDDKACMICHSLAVSEDAEDGERVKRLCFHCHGDAGTEAQQRTAGRISTIRQEDVASSPHADVGCAVCHLGATAYPHSAQRLGDCVQCHERHDEKVAHDAHIRVACEACHLEGARPVRAPASARVMWERLPVEPSHVHSMAWNGEQKRCERCHVHGNTVGAAAMILPPKSVLCMPCHAATFSIGDATTMIALILFLAGMGMLGAYVLSGSTGGDRERGAPAAFLILLGRGIGALFSRRVGPILRVLFWDGLLQRRLFRQSPKRWGIHALIFWPFVIRFAWGIAGLLGSLWAPGCEGVWVLLDKNHPATALVFDITGLMVILGGVLALARRSPGVSSGASGLPNRDRLALVLILFVVVVGFVLEGLRMAMTGGAPGSRFAFVGQGLASLFSGSPSLTAVYGYVWYAHAVLTGAFVAYLPYSRLIHIIMAPIVLAMNAGEKGAR
jgi:nitrate reductase gamma subunit